MWLTLLQILEFLLFLIILILYRLSYAILKIYSGYTYLGSYIFPKWGKLLIEWIFCDFNFIIFFNYLKFWLFVHLRVYQIFWRLFSFFISFWRGHFKSFVFSFRYSSSNWCSLLFRVSTGFLFYLLCATDGERECENS